MHDKPTSVRMMVISRETIYMLDRRSIEYNAHLATVTTGEEWARILMHFINM